MIPRQYVAGTHFENGSARVVADGPCIYFDEEAVSPCSRLPQLAPETGKDRGNWNTASQTCKWRFIDKTGKQIVNAEFEGAFGFHEGLAAVEVTGLWGFINLQGVLVIPPSFRSVHSFSDGLALVTNDKVSGFIDTTGNMKISADFLDAQPFSDDLAAVGNPEKGYIYINTQGERAIRERFIIASRFFHGLAHVKVDGEPSPWAGGTFAYIDKTGKRVFTYRKPLPSF